MSEERTKGIKLGPLGAGDALGPSGTNHLLVIAIDEYEHCPVLHNCVKDALGFIEVLKERYNFFDANIQTLYNKEATRAKIHAYLKGLKDRVQPRDNLIIYFSGHGETEDNVGYWVPVEAQPAQEWEFVSTNDIKSRLDAINSFHTFVIVDACFSGALFASYRSVKAGNETKRSRLGLAASHTRERALDGTAGENSPFSQRLLKKLWENTGTLSAHKLAAELIEEVHAATRGRQTPVFKPLDVKGDDSGQYVFRLKADEASDWTACQKTGTLAAYEAFLEKYPKGEHAGEAQEKIVVLRDEEAWQTAKSQHTVSAYFQYRKEKKDGQYRDEALKAIQGLEEDQSWHQAKRKNTIYNYEHYLEKYPSGRYKEEAQTALEVLLGGHAPAKAPTTQQAPKAPPKKEESRQPEPQKKKAELQQVQPAKPSNAEKPAPAKPASDRVPGKTQSSRTTTTPAPAIDKKYLAMGGGLLAVILLVIWMMMPGKSQSTDLTALEVFESNDKFGYRDGTGKEILAAQYEQAEPFQDGRAKVTLDGQTYTIDETGACVADCPDLDNKTSLTEADLSENSPTPQPEKQQTTTEDVAEKPRELAPEEKKPAASISAKGVTFGGKTYPLVNIKGLKWMTKNLDYKVSGSWCYAGNVSSCRENGRLYTWAAAKRACAAMGSGWRLPTDQEWQTLAKQFGGADEDASDGGTAAYKALTAGGSSGFSAQLSGWRKADGSFSNMGDSGYYWSSSENDLGLVPLYYFTQESGELNRLNNDPRLGFSCRCVQ